MRTIHHFAVLVAVSMASCTFPDVELSPDAVPAPPPDCRVNPDFGLVVSNTATTILTRRSDGGPNLLFLLNTDTKPDALAIQLYNNMGGHSILNSVGSFTI